MKCTLQRMAMTIGSSEGKLYESDIHFLLPEDLAQRIIEFCQKEIVHHECSEARAILEEMTK